MIGPTKVKACKSLLITYYQHVSYLLRISQYPVDNTYNNLISFKNRHDLWYFMSLKAKYRGKKSNNINCSDLVLGAKKKEEKES